MVWIGLGIGVVTSKLKAIRIIEQGALARVGVKWLKRKRVLTADKTGGHFRYVPSEMKRKFVDLVVTNGFGAGGKSKRAAEKTQWESLLDMI
jgi:hypothetical protein